MKREVKRKAEKERYTHLNAEFQRIARRDKKAFLSYQCKESWGKMTISTLGREVWNRAFHRDPHKETALPTP